MTEQHVKRLIDLMRSESKPGNIKVVNNVEDELEVIDIIWIEKEYGNNRSKTELIIKVRV